MYRSSIFAFIGGSATGVVSALDNSGPLRSALSALLTAVAVAAIDFVVRKLKERAGLISNSKGGEE